MDLNLVEFLSAICLVFLPETLCLQTLNDLGLRFLRIIFITSSYFKANLYLIASKGVQPSQHISMILSKSKFDISYFSHSEVQSFFIFDLPVI